MSALEEIPIHLLISVLELQCRSRREPICQPALASASGTADPTRQEVTIICVTVTKAPQIVIHKPWREFLGMRSPNHLGTKIKPIQTRELRHIQAKIQRRPARN